MTDSKFIAAAIVATILSGGAVASAEPTAEHAEQAIRGAIAGIFAGSLNGNDHRQCVRVNTFSTTGGEGFTVAAREYYVIDFALSVSYLRQCTWKLYSAIVGSTIEIHRIYGKFGGTIDETIGAEYDRITTRSIGPSEVQSVALEVRYSSPTALANRDTFIEEVKTLLGSRYSLSQSEVDDIVIPSSFISGFVGGKEGSDQDLTGQLVFYRDPLHDREWVVIGVRPLP